MCCNSCLLKSLQLGFFFLPCYLIHSGVVSNSPTPTTVSCTVCNDTIKAFLNVYESLLIIMLADQHVNGCSHCSEVKIVLLSSQGLFDFSSLSIQLLLQPFYSQYNCFMAWSKTPPQLFIGGIFFEENCSSFSWLGLLFCVHLDSTSSSEWRYSRQDQLCGQITFGWLILKGRGQSFIDVEKLLSR